MTNEELKAKKDELENKNSLKSERCADKALRKSFREAEQNEEYQYYEEPELATWLSKFWFGARTRMSSSTQ